MRYLARSVYDAFDPRNCVPHGDRVLVEDVEIERVSHVAGGHKLFLPETHDEEIENGWKMVQIVAVGSGHRLEHDETVPMPFRPGEVWFIERLTGRTLKLHGTTYRIVNQVDILMPASPAIAAALTDAPSKGTEATPPPALVVAMR